MRTFREQLRGYVLDSARRVVYNAGQENKLSIPHQGRQPHYGVAKPHSHSAVFNVFWNRILGNLPFTQGCVKRAQTSQRKYFNIRSLHSGLRKGNLNSYIMRMFNSFKEKQYGKN